MLMTDTQIGMIARAYYNDESFSVPQGSKEINMWNVYNLLTGANKSSYIDNFLDRSLNATQLAEGLNKALYGDSEYSWFIKWNMAALTLNSAVFIALIMLAWITSRHDNKHK